MDRILSVVVILACGLVVVSVLVLLPELAKNWTTEPEDVVGPLLLAAISAVVATLLGLKLVGRSNRWTNRIALVLGVIFAAAALFTLANGGWPTAVILLCAAIPLLIAAKRPKT
ncbi:hypothetical protein [Brevundimonas sp.]|uniref:hypothetical protein n=1 Tax=Brevundimonas sp. TaxID=1871086 RepID=UPI003D0E026C